MSEIKLTERDEKIIRELDRWRVVQGKHIRHLAGFSGQRACDRRLRKLIEVGYIKREKILYGVAGLYSNTGKAKLIAEGINTSQKIRVEQIQHDIAVLDTAIYFNQVQKIPFKDMKTEIELHRLDGFGNRKHRPDFVINKGAKTICVEVELSQKSKDRFLANIQDNFLAYDTQVWVVLDTDNKIADILRDNIIQYPNIKIITLQEVRKIHE
ncbi:MAG: hypothetical protein FWG82_02980 [Oscillospiraceae bacterium]|nr:hypothetical protein [Oscillospiraceae bacterium]